MSAKPSDLAPVPTPLRRRWREFRIRVLPLIAFACLTVTAAVLWQDVVVLRREATSPPATGAETPRADDLGKEACAASTTPCVHPGHSNALADPFPTKD
jgi:hypothetical protein